MYFNQRLDLGWAKYRELFSALAAHSYCRYCTSPLLKRFAFPISFFPIYSIVADSLCYDL
jgi:hypothetical protein